MSDLSKTLTEWRHHLHQHPETAFEEFHTAAFVASKLREMGIEVSEHVGRTGVVGTLRVGDGTKTIGLRADMDALNLKEQGTPAYKSVNEGKMHGCGHDGHTTTLLGAAKLLSQRKNFNGTVRFVFQPAEEPGWGAREMLKDRLLERFPIDEIYGLHNTPALPAGTLHTCPGGFCSSEDNFTIVIHGRGGHASGPHLTIDPLVTAAEIILALQTIVSRNVAPTEPAVVSCTELFTDGAHNAIPSNVTILGDARSYSREVQRVIEERMKAICEETCRLNGASCDFKYTHEFASTVNWAENVEAAVKAAIKVLGSDKVNGNAPPFTGSEDFGLFLEKIPGCFVFLGTGREDEKNFAPLHNPFFDYNDDMLEAGAEFFAELVKERLPQ